MLYLGNDYWVKKEDSFSQPSTPKNAEKNDTLMLDSYLTNGREEFSLKKNYSTFLIFSATCAWGQKIT